MSAPDTAVNKVREDRLWLVTVEQTRTATFWVQAPNWDAAKEDGDELAASMTASDWHDVDDAVDVAHAPRIRRRPVARELIWSGGPDGDWITT